MSTIFSHSFTETTDTNSPLLAQMMGRACSGFWMLLCCFLKSYVQSLKTIYKVLNAIYNMLSVIYNMLSATYNMLSATYNMLSATYNSCKIFLYSLYFNCHKKKSHLNIYINI